MSIFQPVTDYVGAVGSFIAGRIRAGADRRAAEAQAFKDAVNNAPSPAEVKRAARMTLAERAKATPTTFPNDLGSYPKNRQRRREADCTPMTPAERFRHLAAMYLLYRHARAFR